MGLKSGSRDAGLDEEDAEDETPEKQEAAEEPTEPAEDPEEADATAGTESESERPTMDSLPYKLRRNKVNEGREQVPYFLREEVIAAEADLQDALEGQLGESVYKSDYREAAMVVAQRNPDLVAEVLREWGYDLDAS